MDESQVIALMSSSKSEEEWNQNLDAVKGACGGYPSFWYAAVVRSGVAHATAQTWGGTAEIQVAPLSLK